MRVIPPEACWMAKLLIFIHKLAISRTIFRSAWKYFVVSSTIINYLDFHLPVTWLRCYICGLNALGYYLHALSPRVCACQSCQMLCPFLLPHSSDGCASVSLVKCLDLSCLPTSPRGVRLSALPNVVPFLASPQPRRGATVRNPT